MINELLNNPAQLGRLIAVAVTVAVFVYIIILSFLQMRQIRILQQKVQTDGDNAARIITFVYLIVQIGLFALALLFLNL